MILASGCHVRDQTAEEVDAVTTTPTIHKTLIGMPRYRCPDCCCGPAIVLKPPKGATPICSRCGTVLERQPLVRPLPMLVLLTVGSALVALSLPSLFVPQPPQRSVPPTETTLGGCTRQGGCEPIV